MQRVSKMAKQKDKEALIEEPILSKIKEALEKEKPARSVELSDDELKIIKGLHLLTIKPMLYVANVSEDEVADAANNPYVQQVREFAAGEGAQVIVICAKIEEEEAKENAVYVGRRTRRAPAKDKIE